MEKRGSQEKLLGTQRTGQSLQKVGDTWSIGGEGKWGGGLMGIEREEKDCIRRKSEAQTAT